MKMPKSLMLGLLLVVLGFGLSGCAKDARDTAGFAISDNATLQVPFEQAWQAAKAVLREKDFDLYTRDKRGVFVAYSTSKRHWTANTRTQFTITLEPDGDNATKVTVEAVKQVYGVTLLTYPGWHDRKATDHKDSLAIIEAVQGKLSAATPAGK